MNGNENRILRVAFEMDLGLMRVALQNRDPDEPV